MCHFHAHYQISLLCEALMFAVLAAAAAFFCLYLQVNMNIHVLNMATPPLQWLYASLLCYSQHMDRIQFKVLLV